MNELLDTITELSHEFGTPEFVKGGGGNTSCKTSDTLWVKPSGTTLSGLQPGTFVAMDRAKLEKLFELEIPEDKHAREALVKDVMADAVRPGQNARPSVEAPLHSSLRETYVVHTHSVLVNGMTCAKNGASTCRRLFPEALWVPYIDPGFTLCVDVNRRIAEFRRQSGREPNILILENHGIFVSGNSAAEIRERYRHVLDRLKVEYNNAGISRDLKFGSPTLSEEAGEISGLLRELLGTDAAAEVASAPFEIANGPISPDHIVYSKSYPYSGPLTKKAVGEFKAKHGYSPRIISTKVGVFGVGPTPKVAQLALELAQDGALLQQLAKAFGGIQLLTDDAREFIENWEVEAYRAKQLSC
jgi:rhamnose utilization protein RhaD (predicted bifunctional aldolase and dehydrogenase)